MESVDILRCMNFPPLNGIRLSFSQGYMELRSSWKISTSSGEEFPLMALVSSMYFLTWVLDLEEGPKLDPRSLMKMRNSSGPMIDPWGTEVGTSNHFDRD